MKKLAIPVVGITTIMILGTVGCSLFNRTPTYTESDTRITTSIDEEFIIALRNPSPRVGNRWYESHDDAMLSLLDMEYTPDDEEHPDFGGTENYRFRSLKKGTTEVTFTYETVTEQIIKQIVFYTNIDSSANPPEVPEQTPVATPPPAPAPSPPPPPGVIPPAPIGPNGEILTPGPNEAKSFYSVQSDFIPDGGIYFPGEQIDIEVKLTNESTGPVVIEQFPPEVNIYLPDRMDVERTKVSTELGTVIHAFPAGTEERELGVNETASFKLSWDQKDDNGNQVAPGRYYRQMELRLRTKEKPVNSWMSGGGGPAFLIQYPQGAMEKNIDLDISQTASGLPLEVDNEVIPVDVTLTLKHVELTSEGVGFFVLLTSPDYPLPGDDVWWRLALHEHAEYSFDGTVKDARGANTRYTDEGIELRWGQEGSYRDPIPSDTKKLTFTITRLDDDWQGPWEFEIPLE